METILISGMTKDAFLLALRDIVSEEFSKRTAKVECSDAFISVKDVQKLFRPTVSRVTIDNWVSKGLLKKHFIGGRVYFNRTEVLDSLNNIKKY